MKRHLPALVLAAALLLSGCGAAKPDRPASAGDLPAQTAAPKSAETPAPATAETPAPAAAETPAPATAETPAPAAAETPAPEKQPAATETPAAQRAETPADYEGLYKLYSYDSDGERVLAEGEWNQDCLLLRRSGAADYVGTTGDGTFLEWRGIPFTCSDDGWVRFETPEDFLAAGMAARRSEDGLLEVTLSMSYEQDPTEGGNVGWFRRVEMHEGGFDGRSLTDEELAEINETFDGAAFCTCIYARPEGIDWREVCYNGIPYSEELPEAAMDEYLARGGWGELCIESFQDYRLREYVWNSTLTSYELADFPLWPDWFLSSDGYYVFEHGDTNAVPVDFYGGLVDGELYKLFYMRSNWENYVFEEVPFVLTAYIRDGQWQYVSNYPAEWTDPTPLLALSYYDDLDGAKAVNDIVAVAERPEDEFSEPYGWCYAVFTALEDDVRYVVETVDDKADAGYFGILLPGERVADGLLQKGQSAAVYTNLPWHAELCLTASKGDLSCSYIFGGDNWKHLLNEDVRTLVGHDPAGEGRGTQPGTEEELSNFLTDGLWAIFDKNTDELLGSLEFHDYRNLTACTAEGDGFNAFLTFDRYDARPTEAPDVIVMEYATSGEEGLDLPGWSDGDAAGDYQIFMEQLDGEQVLTLRQVSEGTGVLSAAFPGADEGGAFTLHRYRVAA